MEAGWQQTRALTSNLGASGVLFKQVQCDKKKERMALSNPGYSSRLVAENGGGEYNSRPPTSTLVPRVVVVLVPVTSREPHSFFFIVIV